MIDYADKAMLPALKRLWMTCFGDDKQYTGFLFEHLVRPEHILAYTDGDGEPVAMLCLQPFALCSPLEEAEGCYIYGVATHPEQQGRGLSTALLNETHRLLGSQGTALSALVPASESLFQFYGKRGYASAFQVKKATYTAAELSGPGRSCVLAPAAPGQLASRRDAFYADRLYVRWDAAYLRYLQEENAMLGGETLSIACAGEEGIAVCYRAGESVVVKELVMPPACLPDVMAALHARCGASDYTVYLPADTVVSAANKVLPFAMVQWYDKEKQERFSKTTGKAAYIAHILD